MTETRSIIMRVPITLKLGPVPDDIRTHSQLFTFGLAHIESMLKTRGLAAKVDGSRAIVSYENEGKLASFTVMGDKLDDRHYRTQPAEGGHSLQVSTDRGITYVDVGVVDDLAFAKALGDAWVDGRAEKTA